MKTSRDIVSMQPTQKIFLTEKGAYYPSSGAIYSIEQGYIAYQMSN